MKEIIKPNLAVLSLLGKQRHKTNRFRLFSFCLILEVEGGYLLYNNLTKQLLLIDEKEKSILDDIENNTENKFFSFLYENWFIVEDNTDDLQLSEKTKVIMRNFMSKNYINTYTIFTTTVCNARCFYCYEAGSTVSTMTLDTAKKIADFIIKNSHKEKVTLRWFGGEPLCNTLVIDEICNVLKENGIEFVSRIVSNGYLFDEETCIKAESEWHLKTAQITLDGLSNTYARTKNYKNGDMQCFNKVINNIESLLNHNVKVNIRLNIDQYNISEMMQLIDFLHSRFLGKNNLRVYSSPIYEDTGYVPTKRDTNQRLIITEANNKITNYLCDLQLYDKPRISSAFKANCCQADDKTCVIINPNGHLLRCEHHFDDNDSFATIENFSTNKVWNEYIEPMEKCKQCVAQPTCTLLNNCPAGSTGCYPHEQQRRINHVKFAMRNEYYLYKESEK